MKPETKAKMLEMIGVREETTPPFKVGNTMVHMNYVHADMIDEVEKMSTEELVKDWKSLVWLNEIYGQVSINEMLRIALLEHELCDRDEKCFAKGGELDKWYVEAEIEFDIEAEIEFDKNSCPACKGERGKCDCEKEV